MNQSVRRTRGRPLSWLTAAVALVGLGVLPPAAFAQAAPAASALTVTVPPEVQLGREVPLQAHLAGANGAPIAKVTIYFSSPTTFLNVSGDAAIAEGVTDASGLATASWRATRTGGVTIQAAFRGNTNYAATTAMAIIAVTGQEQLYTPDAGVRLPGLNVVPKPNIPIFAALWPKLSAWPIAAALLVVWSTYATVATLIYRIAAAGARVIEPAEVQP